MVIHIDKIKIVSKITGEIDLVHDALLKKFENVGLYGGPFINYVGITFDYSMPGQVKITMLGYEQDLKRFKDCQ